MRFSGRCCAKNTQPMPHGWARARLAWGWIKHKFRHEIKAFQSDSGAPPPRPDALPERRPLMGAKRKRGLSPRRVRFRRCCELDIADSVPAQPRSTSPRKGQGVTAIRNQKSLPTATARANAPSALRASRSCREDHKQQRSARRGKQRPMSLALDRQRSDPHRHQRDARRATLSRIRATTERAAQVSEFRSSHVLAPHSLMRTSKS